METVVVVGGSKSTAGYLQESNPHFQVLFHDARVKSKQGRKQLENLVKRADQVVVMVHACSHQGMWEARETAKRLEIPIHYNRGLGTSLMGVNETLFM